MLDRLRYNLKDLKLARGSDYSGVEAIEMAIKILEAQEWIPVSKRLPEVGRSVLFSRRSMCTREGCLQADGKWWQYWWYELLNADQVTAWKPLPEPYQVCTHGANKKDGTCPNEYMKKKEGEIDE
jgi:hypothetical protein